MSPNPQEITAALADIGGRASADGGFPARRDGLFRPDATAWAILALKAAGGSGAMIRAGRKRLAASQLSDGRVPLAAQFPEAYWPTPLAVLAWTGEPEFQAVREKAVRFLLSAGGVTFVSERDPTDGHNTSLKGWAWIQGSYSWIVPSALAMMALKREGYQNHPRVVEAVRMLVDRQLPSGGWNYGDTFAFGTELLPAPETTGHALYALNGAVPADSVLPSLNYLDRDLPRLRSPLSLAWSLLGLGAWDRPLSNAHEMLLECLSMQFRYGPYDTDLLAQLVVAFFSAGESASVV